ncbi:MAG: hypothetical protein ACLTER_23690 [Ruminococcus sp.]
MHSQACTALTGFTSLPASVSGGIGDAAFMGCKNLHLENVYIHGTDSLKLSVRRQWYRKYPRWC